MDEESSSNLSGFTDNIEAYWPYSMILNPFAVQNQEPCIFLSGILLLCDGATVYLVSAGMLLSVQHGGTGCSSSLSSSVWIFFSIHSFICSLSPVTCRREMCMTRCRTWARYEASLTKSPRHPVKSKTHLDKVTDKNFNNLVCNLFL